MKIIVMTGPPFSGKGTQCEILSKEFNFKHISTGERCRLEKENNTEIGLIMSDFEEKGNLVPDSIMKNLFNKIIEENLTEDGIILDGYPRTIPQVKDLAELLELKNQTNSIVINLEVSKEELLKRAVKRSKKSNRKDDQDVNIQLKRIEVFEEYTKPAIEYMKFKFNVLTIDGLGKIDEIAENIKKGIKSMVLT